MLLTVMDVLATRHSDTHLARIHRQKGNHIPLPAVQLAIKHWLQGTLKADL